MSSFSYKGILSILVSVFLVSGIMYASSTIISVQTQSIAQGDVIANGWFQEVNDIALVSKNTLPTLTGAVAILSGQLSTLSSQWSNYPDNTLPTGIYYPLGNVGIGTLPDISKKLTVVGDTTLSGSVTLPKLPISSTDATNKAYVDAAVVSAAGGGGGSCYYVSYGSACAIGYSQAPGVYYNTAYNHAICCPSSTNNSDLNYCPQYTTTRMYGEYVYTYTIPNMLKGTTQNIPGYNPAVGNSTEVQISITCQ